MLQRARSDARLKFSARFVVCFVVLRCVLALDAMHRQRLEKPFRVVGIERDRAHAVFFANLNDTIKNKLLVDPVPWRELYVPLFFPLQVRHPVALLVR